MQVILPFLSRFLVISGFLADTRLPLVKPATTRPSGEHFVSDANCKIEGALFCRRRWN